MWGDNRVFVDPALQSEVWDRGYALRRLFSAELAAELVGEIEAIATRCGVAFEPTEYRGSTYHLGVFSDNDRYRREINALARDRLGAMVEEMLVDYRLMYSTVFIKPPGTGQIAVHIDDTMQADLTWPGITAWCALTDTTTENGALEFVPKSHSLYDEPFAVTLDPPFAAAIDALDRLAVSVPAAAGEAIFFDRSILHRSNNNTSDMPRIAMPMGLVRKDKPVVFFYPDPENDTVLRSMRMDTAERDQHSTADVLAGKVQTEELGSVPTKRRALSQDEMMALLRHSDDLRCGATSIDEVLQALAEGRLPAGSQAATQKAYFRDAAHEAEFAEKGYFRHPMLSAEQARTFLGEVFALNPEQSYNPNTVLGEEMPYHLTEFEEDAHYKRRFRALADRYFEPIVDDLLDDYRILTATMFIKPAGADPVPLHNDWHLQEDQEWPTIYLWCPLEDVSEENGALRILEGSHGILDFVYGPLGSPAYLGTEHLLEPRMVPVPVAAGEGIVFDASILHGSLRNGGDRPRFAVRLACVPRHRKGVLHMQSSAHPDVLETWSMDTDEFFEHSGAELFDGNLKTRLLKKSLDPKLQLSGEEILHLVDVGARIRTRQATMAGELRKYRELNAAHVPAHDVSPAQPVVVAQRSQRFGPRMARKLIRTFRAVRAGCTTSDLDLPAAVPPACEGNHASVEKAAPVPHGGKDFAPYLSSPTRWTPFKDERIDRSLETQGYATFPFLEHAEVDALAGAIGAAERTLDRDDVHIPTNFQLSAFNNDAAYKERLFDAVWGVLADNVTGLLPDYEPLVINIFDKPVSDQYDPVPIHQNPSFVDEPQHRSISLWIPFDDVDRVNGAVGVLPGSHGRFNMMRSGNMAHEEVFADVQTQLENELFVPVEMRKGEMLALDDSIVHWSYPNLSDRPRKAVQLIMVPSGVPHVYYYYDEESGKEPMMDLYEVDRHFFFGFNCKARPETLKQIGRVPYAYRRITEHELLANPPRR